ncbi:hypothetical protein [Gudongella sp. DL1XJH-153]|uniref:hypothetical protein n=1 Tax=Gudongella sp. DL1XJH-153 TaxID=3409804 RepID=UPI003BB61246
MSIFEILMLLCFGAAWPFAIYKSYTSRSIKGKSPIFLLVLMSGYVFGIMNKLFHQYDNVIYLYMLNLSMIATDFGLYIRNKRIGEES